MPWRGQPGPVRSATRAERLESARMRPSALAALLLVVASACRAVVISPTALRAAELSAAERSQALELWQAAVERANEFLDSPFRRTLPAGEIVLEDAGMRFVERESGRELQPLEVVCSDWGDLLVLCGFAAQESPRGFTVGATRARGRRLVENSLFRDPQNQWLSAPDIAGLVLHELTHDWSGDGALGFAKSCSYYASFLVHGYDEHPDERRANATSEEFAFFARTLGRGASERENALHDLEQHLAHSSASPRCRHGSFNAAPRAVQP